MTRDLSPVFREPRAAPAPVRPPRAASSSASRWSCTAWIGYQQIDAFIVENMVPRA